MTTRKRNSPSAVVPFKDVCKQLGMHWNTGYRLHRQGRFPIPVERIGDRYSCRSADVQRYLSAQPAPKTVDSSSDGQRVPEATVSDVLALAVRVLARQLEQFADHLG